LIRWVFGYGSLVWRPAISHDRAVPARIVGWQRRFWQASTDHRGVPGAPGRVATLVPEPGGVVVGRAYRIPESELDRTLARLDHRERGGYARDIQALLPLDGSEPFARGLVYRATPDNPNWAGEAPIPEIAQQVLTSVGPSGPNPEYVLRLHDALAEWDAVDEHLDAIVRHLTELQRAG